MPIEESSPTHFENILTVIAYSYRKEGESGKFTLRNEFYFLAMRNVNVDYTLEVRQFR